MINLWVSFFRNLVQGLSPLFNLHYKSGELCRKGYIESHTINVGLSIEPSLVYEMAWHYSLVLFSWRVLYYYIIYITLKNLHSQACYQTTKHFVGFNCHPWGCIYWVCCSVELQKKVLLVVTKVEGL